MATVPLMATDVPKASPAAPPVAPCVVAVTSCWRAQLVPVSAKMYAEPASAAWLGAPTMASEPLIATDDPNMSPAAPSGLVDVRSGCWVQTSGSTRTG